MRVCEADGLGVIQMTTEAKKGQCAYADQTGVDPRFHCPKCSGSPTHLVRNYFVGAAKQKLGPHLLLCDAHAKWYAADNPFGARAERIPASPRGGVDRGRSDVREVEP